MNDILAKVNEAKPGEESAWSDFKSADSTTPESDPLMSSVPTNNEPRSNESTEATLTEESKAEDK